jgi:hypothetical protein
VSDGGYGGVPDPWGREYGPMTWPVSFGPDDTGPGEGCER